MEIGSRVSSIAGVNVCYATFTVGSLNGIYGIKSPFPAPTGSATDSTGIFIYFYKRLLSFQGSFTQK